GLPFRLAASDFRRQHLVSAADAEDGQRLGPAIVECPVHTVCPQPCHIVHSGACVGEDDEVGCGNSRRVGGELYGNSGFGGQCVHVGRVGDTGQPNHGDTQCAFGGRLPSTQRQGVLGVEPRL